MSGFQHFIPCALFTVSVPPAWRHGCSVQWHHCITYANTTLQVVGLFDIVQRARAMLRGILTRFR